MLRQKQNDCIEKGRDKKDVTMDDSYGYQISESIQVYWKSNTRCIGSLVAP